MFELFVLPADVDKQAFAFKFERIQPSRLHKSLCILTLLHFNKALEANTWRQNIMPVLQIKT